MSTDTTTRLPLYSIRDWDALYENNRTRSMVHMQWIPVPNKHDGSGYVELVDRKNGAAYLGAWLAILQVASKCEPRGVLARSNGDPHTARTIARMARIDEAVVQETLELCASASVGWLCQVGDSLPAVCPQSARTLLTKKGREENGIEGTEENNCGRWPLVTYGEFSNVKLTAEEYDKLKSKHGAEKTEAGIEQLSAWLERTGKRRKNHYACLGAASWVWEKVAGGITGTNQDRDAYDRCARETARALWALGAQNGGKLTKAAIADFAAAKHNAWGKVTLEGYTMDAVSHGISIAVNNRCHAHEWGKDIVAATGDSMRGNK